jgi:hypothetical protein
MGALLVFAIIFFIGVLVAIRFREAQRRGEGPFAGPPNIVVDLPDNPPPFGKPPVNIGPDGLTRTAIVGGAFDPQFEDRAPQGGLLIGLELAVVNKDSIKAVQPIYLVQGKEVKGAQIGGEKLNVAIKAKKGYAVSSLNVNAGLWLDGVSLTFARLNKGKLDLKDTYHSPYYGGPGGNRSIHGGNGMNVVGVIGRRGNDNSANGIGLLLQ